MAAACSESDAEHCAPDSNIQLSVAIGDIETSSRAATDPVEANPYRGSTPSVTNPFDTAIWFREDGGVYNNAPTEPTYLPIHTSAKFTGPQLTYVFYRDAASNEYNLQYPTDNTNVYCVGLYPKDGWETTDGQVVTHPIDGQSDLMFAAEKSGTWNVHFDALEYNHLLTWIKIAVCATSHHTAEAWGDIEQITITGQSGLKIDLMTGACTYDGNYSPRTVKLLDTNGPDNPKVHINTTMHEVGSIFCSPETSYTLTIKTTNNTEARSITLDNLLDENGAILTDPNDARGKCYVLSLYFKPYNVIEGACLLNAWSNQNEDIYLEEE